MQQVYTETVNGKGNFTSKFTLNSDEALDLADMVLGSDYTDKGGGVFQRFINNNRVHQIRFDSSSLTGSHKPYIPHVHFDILDIIGGRGKSIANNHIPFVD